MRILFVILISLAILLLTAQPVAACTITITPDSATGYVGDILTFTIDVQKTHRTCLIPIDETEINLKGMELVSQTLWQQVSSEVHRKDISVRLTEVGEGLIEVIRECPKGGGSCAVEVIIKEAIELPTTVPLEPIPPITIPEPTLSPVSVVPEPSWWEAFKDGITQPHIIAT